MVLGLWFGVVGRMKGFPNNFSNGENRKYYAFNKSEIFDNNSSKLIGFSKNGMPIFAAVTASILSL